MSGEATYPNSIWIPLNKFCVFHISVVLSFFFVVYTYIVLIIIMIHQWARIEWEAISNSGIPWRMQ
jgi:hypothetical protein